MIKITRQAHFTMDFNFVNQIETRFAGSNNCFIAEHTIELIIETAYDFVGTMEPYNLLKKK